MTNLQHSLRKKFSALTGELAEVRANIERIQREQSKLPELEARIPKLEALIESAAMLLKDASDDGEPEQTPLTTDLLERIGQLYEIETEVGGQQPDIRRRRRQDAPRHWSTRYDRRWTMHCVQVRDGQGDRLWRQAQDRARALPQ